MVELVSQNNFMMNRLATLIPLEEAALKSQNFSGVLVSEDQLETLKMEVHEYTELLWKQASQALQEHLSRPTQKFKAWFEMAGENAIRKENAELRRELEELRRAMEAEQSRGHEVSYIEGAVADKSVEPMKHGTLLHSVDTSSKIEVLDMSLKNSS